MFPKLSIIFVNYQSKNLIKQNLDWLYRQNFPFSFEIIVVNNDARENFSDWFSHYQNLQIITSKKNGGFAFGLNLGAKTASGEYLLVLNPDVVILNNSLEMLIEHAEKNPQVGLVAPKLLNPDGSVQLSCRNWHTPSTILARRTFLGQTKWGQKKIHQHLLLDWPHDQTSPVPWVYGGCFLVRKIAWDDLNGMDERYFLYFEDIDFCRSLWQKNWAVHYLPASQIVHYHSQESLVGGGLRDIFLPSTRIHITSGLKYLLKWRGQSTPEIKLL